MLVIDGAIRDVGTLRQHDFPVYARRQQPKEAAALASIANGTFERGWVNLQRGRMMTGS
ncbi:regulator of RNase E activity RraA [Paraburkholderia sp. JPY158]|uniref:Regulator of RNase E activity RraA n=1 Tax=Paraburkholderia atlantica TaxID=2654982 RepID=A0A7W8Q9B3_PARAM|nr:regulator of RNase E activity RraA [Paraburkholderia atlantica]